MSDPTKATIPCVMSGEQETLTVETIGRFGVSFRYNEDASVIARGEALRHVRAIIDHQLAAWDAAHPTERPMRHPRGRGA